MDDGLESLLSGQQYKKFQEVFYGPIGEKYHLSLLDIHVLLFLDRHERVDTAKDIIQSRHWTKSHVSKSIEKLIQMGYLQRKTDSQDRRRVHLLILEDARPVIDQVYGQYMYMNQILFQDITEEELRVVTQVAQKISRNISQYVRKR